MEALTQSAASATAAATRSAGTAAQDDKAGVISSDFETFLKMLTAQIQNQDPLNPMDSSDYAVQLATFSSVEQQVQTNELLKGMGGGMGGLASYAGWVGMEARQNGPVLYDGRTVTLGLDPPQDAVSTELVVSTLDGIALSRTDITGTGPEFAWSGQNSDGAALLTGPYRVETVSRMADGTSKRNSVTSYAAITEVRAGGSGTELLLATGETVSAETVTALRQPRD